MLEVLPGLGEPRYDPIKAIAFHTRSTSKFYGDDYAVEEGPAHSADRGGRPELHVEARGRRGGRRRSSPSAAIASSSSILNASSPTDISPDRTRRGSRRLREVMADPSVDAVWFARGGYGSNRIAEAALADLPERRARQALHGL